MSLLFIDNSSIENADGGRNGFHYFLIVSNLDLLFSEELNKTRELKISRKTDKEQLCHRKIWFDTTFIQFHQFSF